MHTEVLEVPGVLMANGAQGKQDKANSVCVSDLQIPTLHLKDIYIIIHTFFIGS